MSNLLSGTIQSCLREAQQKLREGLIENARQEARLLLSYILQKNINFIISFPQTSLKKNERSLFQQAIDRRLQHEPLSRIKGEREFWSLPFKINSATLDPRPDSETIIEAVLKDYRQRDDALRILDLGTGSGCLLISLLTEFNQARGIGIDICFEALRIAQENSINHHISDRCSFIQGSWGDPLGKVFDIILSNPPYIATGEIESLMPAVKNYDPYQALNGGPRGFDCYKILANQLRSLCHPKTRIYLEVGKDQALEVTSFMKQVGFTAIRWQLDLAGIERCGVFTLL